MTTDTTTHAPARADMKSIAREHGFVPLRVEGRIPPQLEGTLVRTGPGLYESFGQRIGHSFEADGALSGVRLSGGKAHGAVRLIESDGLLAERQSGRPLFGSRASTLTRVSNLLRRRAKNTGNTSVLAWQHRLFALVESNKPMEISPDDLATLGETNLGGAITATFSAHPHPVVGRKALYNFGISYGPKTSLVLYELPFHGRARHMFELPLRQPVMLHDFAATDRHFVFFVSPARIRIARALLGIGGFGSMIAWEPATGTEVIVVPIDAPEKVVRFDVPAFFQWHFAGCWERGNELIVHFARYDDMTTFDQLRSTGVTQRGCLHEAVLDPARKTLRSAPVWEGASEFPVIDPRYAGASYRTVFLTSERGGRGALAKLDLESRASTVFPLAEGEKPSEIVFVPRTPDAKEGDGFGLSMIYDAKTDTSHLAVLDTARWEEGPVARCHFETHVPMSFHGTWVPGGRPIDAA
jgi:all-trans-8'-apo-beta-carotenal 15,15'-oxygenase